MPRKSAAALATSAYPRQDEARPEPPAHLSDAAKAVWRSTAVTADCPAPLLEAYAEGVVQQRILAQAVAAASTPEALADRRGGTGRSRWLGLLEQQQKQDRHVANLATKLRITPQSRYAKVAGSAAKPPGKKPWQE